MVDEGCGCEWVTVMRVGVDVDVVVDECVDVFGCKRVTWVGNGIVLGVSGVDGCVVVSGYVDVWVYVWMSVDLSGCVGLWLWLCGCMWVCGCMWMC